MSTIFRKIQDETRHNNPSPTITFEVQDINQLTLGDNLEILKNMDSESVDLIYLDPPFFSNKTYEVIWG